MRFEAAIAGGESGAYEARLEGEELDWRPAVMELVADVERGARRGDIARRFHNTLVEWIVGVARESGVERVVLSGGVFQNSYLVERAVERLGKERHRVYTHQRVPPNDGGIALGQAVIGGG